MRLIYSFCATLGKKTFLKKGRSHFLPVGHRERLSSGHRRDFAVAAAEITPGPAASQGDGPPDSFRGSPGVTPHNTEVKWRTTGRSCRSRASEGVSGGGAAPGFLLTPHACLRPDHGAGQAFTTHLRTGWQSQTGGYIYIYRSCLCLDVLRGFKGRVSLHASHRLESVRFFPLLVATIRVATTECIAGAVAPIFAFSPLSSPPGPLGFGMLRAPLL